MLRRSSPRLCVRWVALGGWCGPSLALSKLGLVQPQDTLPYDMVRCTMDGLVHFTQRGFDGFLPTPADVPAAHSLAAGGGAPAATVAEMPMDPVSIWLLFRGQHTCFTHFDLNTAAVRATFEERFERWHELMRVGGRVTFLRTTIAENPEDEARAVEALQEALDAASGGRLDHRIVLAVHHDAAAQAALGVAGTRPIRRINERAVVWRLAHDPAVAASASLFDKTHAGYERIVSECGTDDGWRGTQAAAAQKPFTAALPRQSHLSRVEGVPAFRGTCTGFGSTLSATVGGVCLSCGSVDGHAQPDRAAFDTGRPWSDDENALVVQAAVAVMSGAGMDGVAAVEHVANQCNRGANETLLRFNETRRMMQDDAF
jgi:hypothetical protein